jgi:AraC-like DNA-binding protein
MMVIALTSEAKPHGLHEKNTRFALRQRVTQLIHDELEDSELCPQSLAQRAGISVGYLHRVFAEQGCTVSDYIVEQRLGRAYARLASHQPLRESITQIAFQVGFKNCSHFSKAFHQRYGQSPSQLRAKLLH